MLASPLLLRLGFDHGITLRGETEPADVHLAKQVHGGRCVRVVGDVSATAREEADALVAFPRKVGAPIAVGVRVADCVPVIIGDASTGAALAVHAGWRGVVAQVIANGVEALGARRAACAIGPSIGPCCFEVGLDVADAIARACGEPAVIARRAGEKAYVDLKLAVRAQLTRAGVADEDIDDSMCACTRCDPLRFHSYRRDGANGGRHHAFIRVRS